MRSVTPGENFVAYLTGAPGGLAGSLTFSVREVPGHAAVPTTVVGIVQHTDADGAPYYAATASVPASTDPAFDYEGVWTNGGVIVGTEVLPLQDPGINPSAGQYTTASLLRKYMRVDETTLSDAEADALLQDASVDLDTMVFLTITWPDPALASGLRLDTTTMSIAERVRLARACAAQAEYRSVMGPTFFIRAQYNSTSGPDFNTQGKLPLIGPKVKRELGGGTLLPTGTRAVAGTSAGIGPNWPGTPPGGPTPWRP